MRARGVSGRAGIVAAVTVVADIAAKLVAQATLDLCSNPPDCKTQSLLGVVEFVRLENAGSVLGYGQGLWVWTAIAAVGLLLIPVYAYFCRRPTTALAIGAGLQAGGALGNFVERIVLGGVTDFLLLWDYVINPADVALVAGMVIAVIELLRSGWRLPDSNETQRNKQEN